MTSREESRRATQVKVTESAEKLFLRQGFRATTVRDIALDAGVSVGSVMKVGDKSALLVSMFDRSIAEMHQSRPAPSFEGEDVVGGQPIVDKLYETLGPFLEIFSNQMELAREYAAVLLTGDHPSIVFEELAGVLIGEIEEILRQGGLDDEQLDDAARTVYLSYLGTLFFWAGRSPLDFTEARSLLSSALRFVADGSMQR